LIYQNSSLAAIEK